MPADPQDALTQAAVWARTGVGVALATVIATWRSSPCPAGSQLAIAADGRFAGSISGGCVESSVIEHGLETIQDGEPRLLSFGVSDEAAWSVGLACGGTVRLYVERIEA